MTDKEPSRKEKVFFTAGAIGVAAMSAVITTQIYRHLREGRNVILEAEPSDEVIDAKVAYVSGEDNPDRVVNVEEVHAVGTESELKQLQRTAVEGEIHIVDDLREDS